MNITQLIAAIDAEIERLARVKKILSDSSGTMQNRRGRPKKVAVLAATSKPKRRLSTEARAKIAAAQKVRWAKARKGTKR